MPPPELRCVWMTAGVLSYQLCDRQFACEECPLDQAMRMHFTKSAGPAERPPDEPLKSSVLYSRNHFRLSKTEGAAWRAGIEPRLVAILPPVKSVVLRGAGDILDVRSPAAWIVFDDDTLPLMSPANGTVVRTNEQLRDRPHLLTSPLSSENWLFEIAPASAETFASHLAPQEVMGREYDRDDARFQALLEEAVNRASATVGPTLPDGGKRLGSLIAMVGLKKYCEFLIQAFVPQGGARKKFFSES